MGELTKVAAPTALELCGKAQLGDTARAVLTPTMTPQEYLSALVEGEHFTDAVKFLTHALPKREAVGWACLCAREVTGPDTPALAVQALEAAERWVHEPSEEHRRAAMAAAEASGLDSPGACAAFGAFVSDGSLAPPDVPAVPPADHLTAHAVGGAVTLAAVMSEPEKAAEKYRRFLDIGIGVAKGEPNRTGSREAT
jgi:hypothetical protein